MANMSYCRFENTSNDLRDCIDAMQEAFDDNISLEQFKEDIGKYERYAFQQMLEYCENFIKIHSDWEEENS